MSLNLQNATSKKAFPPVVKPNDGSPNALFGKITQEGDYWWIAHSNELHMYSTYDQRRKAVCVFEEHGEELPVITSLEVTIRGTQYLIVSLQCSGRYNPKSRGQLHILHLRTLNTVRVIDLPLPATKLCAITKVRLFASCCK